MALNTTNILICRVCMCQNDALKSIFALESFAEHMLRVNEVMTSCASVQVESGDGLPQEICADCLKLLSEAYTFRKLCEQTDFTLRNNLVIIIKAENKDVLGDLEEVNIADASIIEYESEGFVKESEEVTDCTEEIKEQDNFDNLVPEVDRENSSSYENKAIKISTETKEKSYHCEICSKNLLSKSGLRHHKRLHGNIKPYECDVCNQRYAFKQLLEEHKKTHSNIKPYICDQCGSGFNYYSSLYKHKKTFHGPEKLRECPVCQRFFSNEALKRHLTTHTLADKSHQCDHCGKCFYNSSKLVRHLKTHVGQECYICRKYFTDKMALEEHRSTHTDADKTHRCAKCGTGFFNSWKLARHVNKHTEEKVLMCVICNKHCRDAHNLRQHMTKHTGEKNFKCDVCGECFAVKASLTKHKKKHTANELKKTVTKNSKLS